MARSFDVVGEFLLCSLQCENLVPPYEVLYTAIAPPNISNVLSWWSFFVMLKIHINIMLSVNLHLFFWCRVVFWKQMQLCLLLTLLQRGNFTQQSSHILFMLAMYPIDILDAKSTNVPFSVICLLYWDGN